MGLQFGIQALSVTRQFVQVRYVQGCLPVSKGVRFNDFPEYSLVDFLIWWVDFAVLTLGDWETDKESKRFESYLAMLQMCFRVCFYRSFMHMGFRIAIYWWTIVGFPLKQICVHIGMRMFVGFSGPGW